MTSGRFSRRQVIGGAAATAAALTTTSLRSDVPIVHEVAILTFKFEPQHLRVHVGDTIRWTNHDLAPHTATADQFGWDTGEIAKDEIAEVIVTAGMETSYFCAFHPHMKGTIEIL
ncbi:plastocyanin/azurin family copper-binding protein [Halocynthiibacter styelae]|uniref:Twin-arginine translocation signal domain-containing protein n=1 Tax=Halocynthiibacter styelae TaxID=2761955 RepID=A0A8J7IL79_9RHOB|nr:plastocyanin/azurin family copper-binding protein [Paenihalocynthiibacter styelae]MBI1495428.1 twin-arginine translocation signal domain-containing protein [Paenihalocynthiibacter styelae]